MSVDPKSIHADASQRDWRAFVLRWLRAIGIVPEVSSGDSGKVLTVRTTEDGIEFTAQGSGNGLDADKLDGEHGSFYRDADNLNAGTVADARLPAEVPLTDEANAFTKLQTIPASRGAPTETINDDAAYSFTPVAGRGALCITTGGFRTAIIEYEAVDSGVARISLLVQDSAAAIEVSTGVLTGTDGTDGKLTVSTHTDGKIYVENRLGAQAAAEWGFLVSRLT